MVKRRSGIAPSWHSFGRWHWLDSDWNSRFPFGISMSVYLGRQADPPPCEPDCEPDCEWHKAGAPQGRGLTFELNGPLGDANRLYLWGRRRNIILALPSWHKESDLGGTGSGDGQPGESANGEPVVRRSKVRSWPHLDAVPRYRYRRRADGSLVRNDEPEPLHWGWLTIEQRPRDNLTGNA